MSTPQDNRFYREHPQAADLAAQLNGRNKERARIVEWLRMGGERVRGVWYSWDSEMRGYYSALADRIESGDHTQ